MLDVAGVRGLLKDAQLYGMILVDVRKLLFLLGHQYDKPTAWGKLLAQWQEMGGAKGDLFGGWIDGYDTLLLSVKGFKLGPVTEWTDE